MSRLLRPIAAIVALVALLAACTGAAAGPSVASLDDPGVSSSPGASPAASALSPQDAALAYARCMRDNGVDMPDPQVTTGSGGEVKIQQNGGASVSKDKMNAADAVCHHFMADAAPNGKGPGLSTEDQDKVLAFAKCMRDHGIDMPDPDFSAGGFSIRVNAGGNTNTSGGAGPKDDPAFQAAQTACSSLLPGKIGIGGPSTDSNGGTETNGGPASSMSVNQ
jgi:hypothetical protein